MKLAITQAPPPRRSLASWAALAIILIIGSYIVSLLLAVACVYLPYLLLTETSFNGLQALMLFLCGLVMAATMLWSLVPRRDKFSPPGARLDSSHHPRLFAELERVAKDLDEPVPREVYAILDVNAWVAERGGVMGFGGRRVMGLGLPLLRLLTLSQFRAILAHEFGHYYGGDTRLGPWVYKTQAAMARTLGRLDSPSDVLEVLKRGALARLAYELIMAALQAYWRIFLRATQMVSRRQEYRADELACYAAGSKALIDGLRCIHGASVLFPAFWQAEVMPVLDAGYYPPIAEGFARFIAVPNIASAISDHLETEIREAKTHPFDSHPPLRERIAAARLLPADGGTENDQPAVRLLDEDLNLEVQMLEVLNPKLKAASLRPVRWDEVGPLVYVPAWRSFVREYPSLLAGYTAESLPDAMRNLREMGSHIRDPKGMLLTPEQRAERAGALMWMALALALIDHGWELNAQPGQFYLQLRDRKLDPVQLINEIASGTLTRETWVEKCRVAGITDLKLHSAS